MCVSPWWGVAASRVQGVGLTEWPGPGMDWPGPLLSPYFLHVTSESLSGRGPQVGPPGSLWPCPWGVLLPEPGMGTALAHLDRSRCESMSCGQRASQGGRTWPRAKLSQDGGVGVRRAGTAGLGGCGVPVGPCAAEALGLVSRAGPWGAPTASIVTATPPFPHLCCVHLCPSLWSPTLPPPALPVPPLTLSALPRPSRLRCPSSLQGLS